jgi:DNA-binding transcriptional MerR regulator
MSPAAPRPNDRKGRPAAILALPPEDAWPPSDTLITRRQLAELYGVTVEVIRAWERRGKGPPKVTNLKKRDFSPALYRCREARVWLEDMVAAQDAAAAAYTPLPPPAPVEPVIDHRETRKAKAIARVRQLKSRLIEDEPGAPGRRVSSNWRTLAEGHEPFASNVVKRSRPARYWGS